MMVRLRILIAVGIFLLLAAGLRAASEIVIAIRYLQAEGVSHSHLYLYRDDGKFLRQLTTDDSGQDVDPIFAPDGNAIVFSREKSNSPVEFWSVHPLGDDSKKLDSAPEWYQGAKTAPFFTNREASKATESPSPVAGSPDPSASPSHAGLIGARQTYKAPASSVESPS